MGIDDIDVSAATGTWRVKAAAALLGLSGLFLGFTAIQLFTIRFTREALDLIPWAHLGFAALLVLLAMMTYRARTWAAVGGTLLAAVACIGALGWQGYAMAHGIFSLLGLASVPTTMLATIFSAIAISDAKRASTVRQQLADAGMKLGL